MNTLSRLDVFFFTLLKSLPLPLAYIAKMLLGLLAIPILLIGVVLWAVAFALHWVGNRVVEAVKMAIDYDR